MNHSAMNHAHTLRRIGYLQTAPACGDCAHSRPEPQGEFCAKFCFVTSDGARCAHWQPSDLWLRANPEVAALYDAPLSPAELAYAHKAHTL